MSKRRNRARRQFAREQAIRGPDMDREQRALLIDDLQERYRKLAKHASAVLVFDGISEPLADELAASFVMNLIGCAAAAVGEVASRRK